MKWLSAGVTFVNLSVVCGLILGMVGHGLNPLSASLALICGFAFAIAAWLGTSDPGKHSRPKAAPPKRMQGRSQGQTPEPSQTAWCYGKIWFWLVAAFFALFAVRSFCWLLYIDGSDLKIQSPNNLGDLSLHITWIRNFASGVPLWPDNPIYAFSKLRYPAGIDLFNALLCLVHVDLIRGLVWTGLLASLATFYAFFRWGGTFGVAGFLFNGGIAGFQFLKTLKFLDYQGGNKIAWKSIPLSMFVTQRGWLYAIPAALILLWHWREKYFRGTRTNRTDLSIRDASSTEADTKTELANADANQTESAITTDDAGRATAANSGGFAKGPLPFWVELSLYASMPLFHVHTFIALTIVLVIALFFERFRLPKIFSDAPIRKHAATLLSLAFIPATFFVYLVTDQFHAKSLLKWHPGWVQDSADFAAPFFRIGPATFTIDAPHLWLARKTWNGVIAPFFQFWLTNFGLWVLITLALVVLCIWRAWKTGWRWGKTPPADVAFVLPAVAIFGLGYFVQTAPWDWDNLKLMIWGYFLILPFLWSDLIARWAFPERALTCIALFASGFVTLLGGLTAGHPGFGLIDRARLDAIGAAVRPLPLEARFATYPTYNHPVLLQGRKVVLGYPGHLWTQGFDYNDANNKLTALMRGAPNWREIAKSLGVRYIFWGRDETANYQGSNRPWETSAQRVASGDWGAIYDVTSEAPPR